MAFDEKGQADTWNARKVRSARAYRIPTEEVGFPPEDIIFRPEHPSRRHGHRGTQQLRRRLHRGDARDQSRTCRLPHIRRRLQRVVLLPRQQAGARGDPRRFLFHAIRPAWTWASSTPVRWARSTTIDPNCANMHRRRGAEPPPRRHRAAAHLQIAEKQTRTGEGDQAPPNGEVPVRGASAWHALVKGIDAISTTTPRRRAGQAVARSTSSRPADGRHERRRRPLRRRQDVPAPGGEVGPGDEEAVAAYLLPY